MKTIEQAAAALGVSRTRIMTLIRAGQLETRQNPHYPKKILITEAAIAARIKAKRRWLATRRPQDKEEPTHGTLD